MRWLSFLVAPALLASGCSWASAKPSEAELATLALTIETCGALATHTATAVVINQERAGSALALTVAHALDKYEILEVRDSRGNLHTAEVAFVDLATDTAVLRLPDLPADAVSLPLVATDELGLVRLVSYDGDEIFIQDSEVLRRAQTTIDGEDPRRALQITGEIKPGDSGSPIVNDKDQVIGIVFASARGSETGWAIDASEYLDVLSENPVMDATILPSC